MSDELSTEGKARLLQDTRAAAGRFREERDEFLDRAQEAEYQLGLYGRALSIAVRDHLARTREDGDAGLRNSYTQDYLRRAQEERDTPSCFHCGGPIKGCPYCGGDR